jgi:CheY-like chemotaxis protein
VPRVTVVNDNPEFLELVGAILEDERYTTTLIDGDAPDTIDRIRASNPDLLMIDLRMGTDKLHGWTAAMEVRREPALEGLPILVCSADVQGLREIEDQLEASRSVGTLVKPFNIDALSEAIDELLSEAAPR